VKFLIKNLVSRPFLKHINKMIKKIGVVVTASPSCLYSSFEALLKKTKIIRKIVTFKLPLTYGK